jgi:hypothetical protein
VLLIIQHAGLINHPDARNNGRDSRTAAKMAASPLIIRKSEMATAIVSIRSSRRSLSSCSALRNEASEYDDACGGSVLGESSVGNVQVSSRMPWAAPSAKAETAHGERSAMALAVSAACAAKVAE